MESLQKLGPSQAASCLLAPVTIPFSLTGRLIPKYWQEMHPDFQIPEPTFAGLLIEMEIN